MNDKVFPFGRKRPEVKLFVFSLGRKISNIGVYLNFH